MTNGDGGMEIAATNLGGTEVARISINEPSKETMASVRSRIAAEANVSQ
eukprot:CAMPEP_0172692332 /NCGR_PEP_ID=MMETSP1074-20121228/25182_1 /TAXON_ID=2916 /ORGANISM="Ceratium fusus, Strain PA161109" /LENGTH=48 /DNA_ID= /DNA_START= /DNA_END= /DNA_ORIENTATION=